MTNLVMVRDQTGDAPFVGETSLLFGSAMAFFPFASWRLGARYLELSVEPLIRRVVGSKDIAVEWRNSGATNG